MLLAVCAFPPPGLEAQPMPRDGEPDPVFSKVPFEQWLSETSRSRIRWSVEVSQPELSVHQRLVARISVNVDGAELARRRGKGQFLVLAQINDAKGGMWRNHQQMDLEIIKDGMKANDAVFSQSFFVLPGDYRVSVVILADATGEHSVMKRKLHVPDLRTTHCPARGVTCRPSSSSRSTCRRTSGICRPFAEGCTWERWPRSRCISTLS